MRIPEGARHGRLFVLESRIYAVDCRRQSRRKKGFPEGMTAEEKCFSYNRAPHTPCLILRASQWRGFFPPTDDVPFEACAPFSLDLIF